MVREALFGLLADLALAVQAAVVGADPLIAVGSDRLRRLSFDLVPARFDSVESKLERGLIGITDARIIIETNQDPKILEGVPPARIAAREKAGAPLALLAMQKGTRTVFLGNGMYPTAARAQLYGISQADLAKMFWSGIDLDYTQLQASAAEIQGVLAKGKEVRVTNPNGTDLTASIAGRPVLVSDGVISADDEKRGGPAVLVYLPAGEVYVSAVPGSAHGTVVVDHMEFMGKTVEGLRLTIDNGKVTGMTAKSGLEPVKAAFDAAAAGKDLFGVFDLGINPNVKIPAGSRFLGWVPAGMVTLTMGNDTWAGGSNNSNFGLSMFVPGSTLAVDGTPLVKDGSLQPAQVATR